MFAYVVLALAISVILSERVDVANQEIYVYIPAPCLPDRLESLRTMVRAYKFSYKQVKELAVGGWAMPGKKEEWKNLEMWDELNEALEQAEATEENRRKELAHLQKKQLANAVKGAKKKAKLFQDIKALNAQVDALTERREAAKQAVNDAKKDGLKKRAKAEADRIAAGLKEIYEADADELDGISSLAPGLYRMNVPHNFRSKGGVSIKQFLIQQFLAKALTKEHRAVQPEKPYSENWFGRLIVKMEDDWQHVDGLEFMLNEGPNFVAFDLFQARQLDSIGEELESKMANPAEDIIMNIEVAENGEVTQLLKE